MKRLICVVLIAVAACGSNWHGDGRVASRSFDPDSTYVTMVCYGYDKNGVCTLYMPITNHTGDHWYLHVTDADGKTHAMEVSEDVYDHCGEGRHIVKGKCTG